MSRYDVKIKLIPNPSDNRLKAENGKFVFENGQMRAVINAKTGTLDEYAVDGKNYIARGGFLPLAIVDDENSWAHKQREFREIKGVFKPMSRKRGAEFSGIIDGSNPPSVRVIEDGAVRTVIEAVMEYAHSQIVLRYYLPKRGTQIKVTAKVFWNEKMTMLKLSVPTLLQNCEFIGQTAYGSEHLLCNGEEMVSQKWNLVTCASGAVSVVNNCTYGSDFLNGELRITCLRSPGYAAGKSDFSVRKQYIMEQDRFSPFIDQGERDYEFILNASDAESRRENVEREAAVAAEHPMVLSFFPTGLGNAVKPFCFIDGNSVTLSVFKRSEDGKKFIIRLFNPTRDKRAATVTIPAQGICKAIELNGFEFKSFAVCPGNPELTEVDLLERPL